MKIFPAIDIKDGRVVRLTYGDYGQMKVYDLAPLDALHSFEQSGAEAVHIVDLDGAKDGQPGNFATISALLGNTKLFCQIGGGIRNMDTVKSYLNAGADRVILGTAAIADQTFLAGAVAKYGAKIAVGVDARDSKVAIAGWLETTDMDSFAFCEELKQLGVQTVIYTDIAKDGAMQGCNMDAYQRLSTIAGLDVVASGGISSLAELAQLQELGIAGAILGKALYNGLLDLPQVLALVRKEEKADD